ncbi:MAG TPA: ABC transporter substrate-binding protein, partial [Kofleriaceae bacterium]|nr:ABC transporter substrate-binding protein [Kofleriaceae bacterium]
CEGPPPRVKPWRHAPDPRALAEAAPRSPVLVREGDDVAVRARRAHTLRIHVDAEPRGLNPLLNPSIWTRRIMMGTVFETLIHYAPPEGGAGNGPGRYLPGLARAWRLQLQNTEIILDLDPAARWQDGKPVTSVDVQYSLDIARDPDRKLDHLRPGLESIDAVELVTSKSVRIRLHQPDGWVLRALAEVPIVPRAVYDPDLGGGGRLVGSGPYKVASTADDVIHLVRVDDYPGPRPAIPDLEFVYQPDAAAALMAAKRGEIDIVPALVPEHWPEQPSAPGLAANFVALELRPPRFRYMLFQAATPPTDDVRVRRGLALLIDRKRLAQEVDDGLTRPIAGPIWPGGPGDGPAPAAPEIDPDGAGRLFDEAGWIDSDGDGIREKGATKLSLEVLVVDHDAGKPHPEQVRILDDLKRAGIGLDIRAGTEAVLRNRIREGHYNLAFLEWSGAVDTDLTPLVGTGGAQNFGGFSSKPVDHALAALRQVWEPASRGPLVGELAAALAEDMPLSGIVALAPQGLVHRRVKGLVPWDGWFDLTALSLEADPAAP